ncbi:hypothetical protein AB7C87_03215 [Natrarchaeobius sp. A-rgal3]|uniref:hypothetical protein n=1 Tax=Natrarchaeobius versutus TaxID=1679078 RepID=UPI0035109605
MKNTDRLTRRRTIALTAAVGATALAGCGDEGPGEPDDTAPENEEPVDDPEDDPAEEGNGDDPMDEENGDEGGA